ncbi:MAG TPA: GNAT family N-acetyltransferase [Candidatus Dormibacteraeota bacterium]
MRQDAAAAALWRTAGEGAHLSFATVPGVDLRRVPEGWLTITGEPIPDLNGGFVDRGVNDKNVLRDFVNAIRERGFGGFILLTTAAEQRLAPLARDLGLTIAGPSPLMAYEPTEPPAPSDRYRVDVVKDRRGLDVFTDLMSRGYEVPVDSWRRLITEGSLDDPAITHLIASSGEEPYSCGSTIQTGSSVGIWNMATPPEHQGKGAGRALLLYALRSQMMRGSQLFYLLASEAGRHLYQQVGFRTLDEATAWLIEP